MAEGNENNKGKEIGPILCIAGSIVCLGNALEQIVASSSERAVLLQSQLAKCPEITRQAYGQALDFVNQVAPYNQGILMFSLGTAGLAIGTAIAYIRR